jgi:hypothetical protein
MRIESVAAAFPAHRHPQAVITEALKENVLSSATAPSNGGAGCRHITFALRPVRNEFPGSPISWHGILPQPNPSREYN